MILKEFLKKGGYDLVSFYTIRNAVEKFIRANYTSGKELRGLDDISKTIEKTINSEVYSLERFYKYYEGSMTKWVDTNVDYVRDLIYKHM